MPNGISEKAKTDFLTWLSETYDFDWTWLQLPEVLMRFGSKNNQWYQYWAKYVYEPPTQPVVPKPTFGGEGFKEEELVAEELTVARPPSPFAVYKNLPPTVKVKGKYIPVAGWELLDASQGIYAPILALDEATLENTQELLNNLYIATNQGFVQLESTEVKELALDPVDFNRISMYWSLTKRLLDEKGVDPATLKDNPGLNAVIAAFADQLASGNPLPEDALARIRQVSEKTPSLTELGIAGEAPFEFTGRTTQLPVSEQLRRMQIDMARNIAILPPDRIDEYVAAQTGQMIPLLQQSNPMAALDFIEKLAPEQKREFYPRILGQSFAGIFEGQPTTVPIPTEFGIGQFLQDPANIPVFEGALKGARQRAQVVTKGGTETDITAQLRAIGLDLQRQLEAQRAPLTEMGEPEAIPKPVSLAAQSPAEQPESEADKRFRILASRARQRERQMRIQSIRPQRVTRI